MFEICKRTGSLEISLGHENVIPNDLEQFTEVRHVTIDSSFVLDVSNLSLLPNLNGVCFSNCKWEDFPKGLSEITNLKSIEFFECTEIASINLDNLFHLEKLSISDCYDLRELRNIEKLVNLKELDIAFCFKIDLTPLNRLKNLKYFKFRSCGDIDFTLLSDLVMSGCYFSADIDEWESSKPQLDLSSATASIFVDNDRQFVDVIDGDAANQILFEHIKKIRTD